MKLFRSKESKKKHEKAKQDKKDLVSDAHSPMPSVLPNQDPVFTQRPLQQPPAQDYHPQRKSHSNSYARPGEDHPVPARKSRDYDHPPPTGPRLRAQQQPPPAHGQAPMHMSQPSPATDPRPQSQSPPAHRQAPMHMSQPSPAYKSEIRVETLKPSPARSQNHAADPPQASFASSQPPPSRNEAAAHAEDSVSALKETFGVDPVSQMAQNAVTRELVKRFIADIWNRGELDLIPSVCARGIRFNGSSGMDRIGHDGFKKMVKTIRSSLEDYHCEIHSMVVEGNKAFCRLRFMGRHVGKLLGYDPTGRQVSWMGAMEFTVTDGLIVKVWELGDMASLEQQLK